MRESQFLKQNRERWLSYEQNPEVDPDELADRFIRLTDDLSYARTFFPGSRTAAYLNDLTGQIHLALYKTKKQDRNRIIRFWTLDVPMLMARHLPSLGYSLLFFLFFVFVGVLSAHYDDQFIRVILGDQYVDMTIENMENGDPFGVYKSAKPMNMFFAIAMNNIYVSCRVFVMGILFGVGTVYGLLYNGVMLGAFEYFFFAHKLGWQSILVVFIHGTLEISAIIVAGAAGLVLGRSMLFPGTYPRWYHVQAGAKDGLKIIVSLLPVFILAAFIEAFVTRYTEMPLPLSVMILFSSLLFVLGYYVYLPMQFRKKFLEKSTAEGVSLF